MRKKYINLRMDDLELHYDIKVQSAEERKTLIVLVQDVLRAYMKKKKK